MAKKTASKKRKKKPELKEEPQLPSLPPETTRGIFIVVLLTVAFLSILSFFGLAGRLGEIIDDILKILFGWGKYVFPFLLLALSYILFSREKYILKPVNYLGLFLLVLSYSGILHLFVSISEATDAITKGEGGGYLGLALSYPLVRIMGLWATLIVLIALLIISLLIFFSLSLEYLVSRGGVWSRIFGPIKNFISRTKKFDEQELEKKEDYEEPESKEPTWEKTDYSGLTKKSSEQMEMFSTSKKKAKIELSLDLLEGNSEKPTAGDINANITKIQKTLENFGISVEMGEVNIGPTVTQYTLRPAEGVKLSQITTLNNDIALAVAAHPIRIEAPIPGKSLIGIEVPNQKIATVHLKSVFKSDKFKKRNSGLSIGLGRDVSGQSIVANLDGMPHLLIAGATGSGKSVCINTIIISLLFQNSAEDLKFILVDPKRVELSAYNGIPHLLTPVITEVDKTINALRWAVSEMERRYHLLSKEKRKNIQDFNAHHKEKLPFVVIIIDELADFMSVAPREVEAVITRLAQMARAVGIHLVVATQRPSVDVITGLIKANITSRISFSVASAVDSRTILDFSGAERLLGNGDMLFVSSELSKPKRIQGAYVSNKEIERISKFLKEKDSPDYLDAVTEKAQASELEYLEGGEGDDVLLVEAKKVILESGKASASLLQRRLRVGYARAARLLDILEKQGIIGPADGAKPREILIDQPKDDYIENEEDEESPE